MHSWPNTDVLATLAAKTIKPRIHFLLFWAARRSHNMVPDGLHLDARARLALTHRHPREDGVGRWAGAHPPRLCAVGKAWSVRSRLLFSGRRRSNRGLTMPDRFNEKRGKVTKAVSQVEIDAQRIREKTARLRALRLAQEAANGGAAVRAPARSAPAKKKQARKPGEKGPSLSDWLDTQHNQGRRG
jgi:hypothetical protein